MTRYVALLRGVNIGQAKRVAMADLRQLLAALKYRNVRTLLNSGNAVFDAPAGTAAEHARQVHQAIASRLGVTTNVVVKSAAEFGLIVAENSLQGNGRHPSRLHVVFVQERSALASLRPVVKAKWTPELIAVGKEAAYLWCPDGMIESKVAAEVARQLGEQGTNRNWATVEKLAALLTDES